MERRPPSAAPLLPLRRHLTSPTTSSPAAAQDDGDGEVRVVWPCNRRRRGMAHFIGRRRVIHAEAAEARAGGDVASRARGEGSPTAATRAVEVSVSSADDGDSHVWIWRWLLLRVDPVVAVSLLLSHPTTAEAQTLLLPSLPLRRRGVHALDGSDSYGFDESINGNLDVPETK
uniref:Uncharacterized protein n=1 Tax=Oryza glumipatula TaxID=40148 RepID=A0A0E0AV83_9ORYZ